MQDIIHWVRYLRQVPTFSRAIRFFVVFLLVLGTWVATRQLDFPSELSLNDKLIHLVVFFGFSVLMDLAISRRPFLLWKGLPLLFYGVMIEFLQYFSPDRTFSLLDLAADFAGILLYFIIKLALLWVASMKLIGDRY